ncbi:hypothetical protein JOB18_027862 [Solea senegalensis]|uniref:TIR domain-containing adapter molecule 1-like n=1 Tax=Solea senegalensis TaxID=28829 RepID=A0AAV6T7S4_SOLSE|nr:TIR domain-containing adapter molecule 1 [Solea senegalensis]XP_043908566.1 TIR domain-containing adapter molecule 1 [Solea senegalensis]KAG7525519.1 TIR domain-containing adapter molecule 1-like [Solea senegalensis]KAG7525520.1 hypothetical protein JOB18_027862 [Solea senegalensis]
MCDEGQENPGTGLRDVFDILFKEPPERLLSLTIQLGESLEENFIHALCLIILQKEAQALNKLQLLKDNYFAKHLAERWKMSGGNLAEFGVHCGDFQVLTGDSLAVLARMFKVLSERRLCDPLLRNLAYQRALSIDSQKASDCDNLEYDPLREEAKVVCGPVFEEWMSSRDLKSGSCYDPHRSLGEVNTTLEMSNKPERDFSLASPLQASSSMPSYPTHLEISIPPTVPFQGEVSVKSKQNSHVLHAPASLLPAEPEPKSVDPSLFEANTESNMDAALAAEPRKLESHTGQNKTPNHTTKPSREPKMHLHTPTNPSVSHGMCGSKGVEDEEEETFYAFVILHAPEDVDVAERMKTRLETATGFDGATFSEDFAIPGRSSLRCVEDAINNSAFTFLLLTRNFNTRMVEVETDTALINSLNKKHKHNTVIPLLPQENSIRKENMPMVLKTIVSLEENKNFERKVKKVLSPANIKKQQRIWKEGQRMKSQMERQNELKRLNQYQRQLIQQSKIAHSLENENLTLLMAQHHLLGPTVSPGQGGSGAMRQQAPNIHIEHAQYIMIGNDSQMTVDHSGGAGKEEQE